LDRFTFVGAAARFGSDISTFSLGGNMVLLFAGLAVVILLVLSAFAAGFVMVAREQMAIDERLYHCTH